MRGILNSLSELPELGPEYPARREKVRAEENNNQTLIVPPKPPSWEELHISKLSLWLLEKPKKLQFLCVQDRLALPKSKL
jgi:hypothetical protein